MLSWHLSRRALDDTAFQITDLYWQTSLVMDHPPQTALQEATRLHAIAMGSLTANASTPWLSPKAATVVHYKSGDASEAYP
jgi:hypothetical protein